ncbi:MAG: hypothetical protein ABFD63_08000 [Smithella sp.]
MVAKRATLETERVGLSVGNVSNFVKNYRVFMEMSREYNRRIASNKVLLKAMIKKSTVL